CQAFGPLVYMLPSVVGGVKGLVAAGPGLIGFFAKVPGVVTGAVGALGGMTPALLAAAPYIALAAGIAGLVIEFRALWKSAQETAAAIAECKLKTEEYAALTGKTAELEAVTPRVGEALLGYVTPGGGGTEIAQQRWMVEQAGEEAPGFTARHRAAQAAQGTGVAARGPGGGASRGDRARQRLHRQRPARRQAAAGCPRRRSGSDRRGALGDEVEAGQ
ncbi:unnamed protein product, partial [marine sediment metagenome]